MSAVHVGSDRRTRLATCRLYLICDSRPGGRPLSDVLRDAGFEVHLGWVAPIGTRWGALTELEIEALEHGVADHLAADRPVEAAELQDRVVSLLRRHLPERVPDARRRLARLKCQGTNRPSPALNPGSVELRRVMNNPDQDTAGAGDSWLPPGPGISSSV